MLLHDLAAWRYGVRISGPTSRALAPLREQVTEVRGVLCQRGGGGQTLGHGDTSCACSTTIAPSPQSTVNCLTAPLYVINFHV